MGPAKLTLLSVFILIFTFASAQKVTDETLESYVNSYINTNGANAITGAQLNSFLNYIIDSKVHIDSVENAWMNGDTLIIKFQNQSPDTLIVGIQDYGNNVSLTDDTDSLGVGTKSPLQKLDVYGAIKIKQGDSTAYVGGEIEYRDGHFYGMTAWGMRQIDSAYISGAIINNNADNRILTATGSNDINAEEQLTFSDSVLTVGGVVKIGNISSVVEDGSIKYDESDFRFKRNGEWFSIPQDSVYVEYVSGGTYTSGWKQFSSDTILVDTSSVNATEDRLIAAYSFIPTGNDTIGGSDEGVKVLIADYGVWYNFDFTEDWEDLYVYNEGFTVLGGDTIKYEGSDTATVRYIIDLTISGVSFNNYQFKVDNITDGRSLDKKETITTLDTMVYQQLIINAIDYNAERNDKYLIKVRNITSGEPVSRDLNFFEGLIRMEGMNYFSLPAPLLISAETSTDGSYIEMTFDMIMSDPSGREGDFTLTDNTIDSLRLKEGEEHIIVAYLGSNYSYDDTIYMDYNAGKVKSLDGGYLESFENYLVTNNVIAPMEDQLVFIVTNSDTLPDPGDLPFIKITIGDTSIFTDYNGEAVFTLPQYADYEWTANRPQWITQIDTVEEFVTQDTINITMVKNNIDDWFLPSLNEGLQMTGVDTISTLPDFVESYTTGNYWSSTELNTYQVKRFNPTTGSSGNNYKWTTTPYYRPVRIELSENDYNDADYLNGGIVFHKVVGSPNQYYCFWIDKYSVNRSWIDDLDSTLIGTTSSAIGEGLNNCNEIVSFPGHTSSMAQDMLDFTTCPGIMEYCADSVPLITFVVDDGVGTVYTDWFPMFDSCGIPAAAAVITSLVDSSGKVTWTQLQEMETAGWEILSHSVTHPDYMYDLTDSALVAELLNSRDTIRAHGLNCDNFVYPRGVHDVRVREFTSRYYRSAREYGYPHINPEINYDPFNLFMVRSAPIDIRRDLTVTEDYDEIIAYIDEVFLKKRWAVFTLHGFDEAKKQKIIDLIDYIKLKNIEVTTVNGALNKIQ